MMTGRAQYVGIFSINERITIITANGMDYLNIQSCDNTDKTVAES